MILLSIKINIYDIAHFILSFKLLNNKIEI